MALIRRASIMVRFTGIGVIVALIIAVIAPYYVQSNSSNFIPIVNLPLRDALARHIPMVQDKLGNLPVLRGLSFDLRDSSKIKFYLDKMDSKTVDNYDIKRLINYFLGFLAIPEENLWVNLSPYERDRILPESISRLDIGKDLLLEDYVLKQVTSMITNPRTQWGKQFWRKVEKATRAITNNARLPISTFQKIWIVPAKAVVVEYKNSVFVQESQLKVLLDDDYLAFKKNNYRQKDSYSRLTIMQRVNQEVKNIFKRELLPIIEKEVNTSLTFAPLRQMYYSLILAAYVKRKFRGHPFYKHYIDKGKVYQLISGTHIIKDTIYKAYVTNFYKGIYKQVKTEYNHFLQRFVKRQYVSGGIKYAFNDASNDPLRVVNQDHVPDAAGRVQKLFSGTATMIGLDQRMISSHKPIPTQTTSKKDDMPLDPMSWHLQGGVAMYILGLTSGLEVLQTILIATIVEFVVLYLLFKFIVIPLIPVYKKWAWKRAVRSDKGVVLTPEMIQHIVLKSKEAQKRQQKIIKRSYTDRLSDYRKRLFLFFKPFLPIKYTEKTPSPSIQVYPKKENKRLVAPTTPPILPKKAPLPRGLYLLLRNCSVEVREIFAIVMKGNDQLNDAERHFLTAINIAGIPPDSIEEVREFVKSFLSQQNRTDSQTLAETYCRDFESRYGVANMDEATVFEEDIANTLRFLLVLDKEERAREFLIEAITDKDEREAFLVDFSQSFREINYEYAVPFVKFLLRFHKDDCAAHFISQIIKNDNYEPLLIVLNDFLSTIDNSIQESIAATIICFLLHLRQLRLAARFQKEHNVGTYESFFRIIQTCIKVSNIVADEGRLQGAIYMASFGEFCCQSYLGNTRIVKTLEETALIQEMQRIVLYRMEEFGREFDNQNHNSGDDNYHSFLPVIAVPFVFSFWVGVGCVGLMATYFIVKHVLDKRRLSGQYALLANSNISGDKIGELPIVGDDRPIPSQKDGRLKGGIDFALQSNSFTVRDRALGTGGGSGGEIKKQHNDECLGIGYTIYMIDNVDNIAATLS